MGGRAGFESDDDDNDDDDNDGGGGVVRGDRLSCRGVAGD